MYKIQTLNTIDALGLNQFPRQLYEVSSDLTNPDAILVRSASLHDKELPESVKVIARAGAGVNNIPVDKFTKLGIPVLNTPGANANAVKELVLAGLLLACRNICQAWGYVRGLSGDDTLINMQVERDKKQFAGFELPGKTLGIVGLGNVGVKVANAAIALGMRVIGFDPTITVKRAWELSAHVEEVLSLDELIMQSDVISLHVPLTPETRHLIAASRLRLAKTDLILLNFARDGIVDKTALRAALDEGKVLSYVCDFPCAQLKDHPRVISLPHLGASTREAEQTCAMMAVKQIRDYLETGNIVNSVNFPTIEMPFNHGVRLAIVNANIPSMVAQISTKLADVKLNIVDLLNRSRDQIAYTLIDVEGEVNAAVISEIAAIEGVIQVRRLEKIRLIAQESAHVTS
ncbi:MAG TPA: phosphoglycerate dehydrogenase [Gammaproteobacteria bacterium]|nr:phosphoglycerate dehydrogenase [Gammaproteobacteria bacterium]